MSHIFAMNFVSKILYEPRWTLHSGGLRSYTSYSLPSGTTELSASSCSQFSWWAHLGTYTHLFTGTAVTSVQSSTSPIFLACNLSYLIVIWSLGFPSIFPSPWDSVSPVTCTHPCGFLDWEKKNSSSRLQKPTTIL